MCSCLFQIGTTHLTSQVKKNTAILNSQPPLLVWDIQLCSSSVYLFCMIAGQLNDSMLTVGSVHMCFMYSALHTTVMCLLTQTH